MSSEVPELPLAAGRYRLIRVLGVGGMATVFEAHDARLDVRRAIKVLDDAMFQRERIRERFEAEARTMARLVHPNICTVHDVGVEGERAYIVMEYLDGGTLQDCIERGGISPRQAVEWMLDVLRALGAAHAAGVIHRDLKPQNVLLARDGTIKLADFGIAQLRGPGGSAPTRAGAVLGTPAFMPPEQNVDSSSVGAEADIYAAGATLFALLTGREPHDLFAAEAKETLLASLPPALTGIVDRATRYVARDRYPSAAAMSEALRAALPLLDGFAPLSPTSALAQDSATFSLDEPAPSVDFAAPRRSRAWLLLAPAGLLLAAGVAALWPPSAEAPPAVAAVEAPRPPPVVSPEPAPAPVAAAVVPATAPPHRPVVPTPTASSPPPPAPEPTSEPTPAPAPVAAVGPTVTCRLSSSVPGSVAIDGQTVGRTPYVGQVSPGSHRVSISPDGGAAAFVRTFSFDVGRPVSYCHDFEAGRPCK